MLQPFCQRIIKGLPASQSDTYRPGLCTPVPDNSNFHDAVPLTPFYCVMSSCMRQVAWYIAICVFGVLVGFYRSISAA